ncbi:MAG: glutamate-1-semialdehyde 2,1-aminomutase [Gammaproteobacteria bacterium]|nr:glutamate-1-semialdehyde 2,1-aminomutase [Gammaproteobacteria bacterium]
MSRSDELFARSRSVTPGGVHSPVRSFKTVGGTPVFIESADGAAIVDVDGHTYIDYCMAFGPLIFGHADVDVRTQVINALERGWSYGAVESVSLELAEMITGNIAWIDSVRFVNSGTEAVMTAIRLARAATGRDKILKFEGCYHGHSDAMLIRAGSGLAGEARPASAGVTENVSKDTLIAPLDDVQAIETIFDSHSGTIAAVIIEPVPANYGLLPQAQEFLQRLADLCRANASLLIFDEVITGFRLSFGGFAELSGIQPDIVTWGKIIGGGFPVGAVAAKQELMEQLAPSGPVYQAGTLSANPVAMTAGLTTLRKLLDSNHYENLESLGRELDTAISRIANLSLQRRGSIFWIIPGEVGRPVRATQQIPANIEIQYADMFHRLLKAGIYFPPSPYEVSFLSTAHSDAHIEKLAMALVPSA